MPISAWLHGERLREKLAVTRLSGARFSSIRFVTGKLDPLARRTEFLDVARRSPIPMLVVYGAQTPSRSRSERSHRGVTARQALGVHEEFPDLVAEAIKPFLSD